MRIVFDTNILVSPLVFPGGRGEAALREIIEERDELILSKPILDELLGVLAVFRFSRYSLRVLAYVPQMPKAAQDENGASARCPSRRGRCCWLHLTTIAYALVCPGDVVMALIFLANAVARLTIIVITA